MSADNARRLSPVGSINKIRQTGTFVCIVSEGDFRLWGTMGNAAFTIGVSGDVGRNLFTFARAAFTQQQAEAYQPYGRGTQQPHVNLDLAVSAGAAFTTVVFEHLFKPLTNVTIESYFPSFFDESSGLKYSTLARSIYHIKQFHEAGKGVNEEKDPYRIQQVLPLSRIDLELASPASDVGSDFDDVSIDQSPLRTPDLFVIADSAGKWRKSEFETNGLGKAITDILAQKKGHNIVRMIVNCSLQCPGVKRSDRSNISFEDNFWSFLDQQKNKHQICVICSANVLRHAGAVISRRLSIEQTIEDLAYELEHFPPLKKLSSFGRLIVRFGTSFVAYFDNSNPKNRRAELIFCPGASELSARDPDFHGRVNGKNTLLAAAIACSIAQEGGTLPVEKACDAISKGLRMGLDAFESGYGGQMHKNDRRVDPFGSGVKGDELIQGLVGKSAETFKVIGSDAKPTKRSDGAVFLGLSIPYQVVAREAEFKWEILREQVDSKEDHTNKASRINLALAMAKFGVDEVLNREIADIAPDVKTILQRKICMIPRGTGQDFMTLVSGPPNVPAETDISQLKATEIRTISGPVLKVGHLSSVERLVIESVRGVRSAIVDYSRRDDKKPLSIAIFGPPGSGKSFAIKEIVASINELHDVSKKLKFLEYNLSQFSSLKELGHALHHIGSVSNENHLPVVFFDEFDCVFDEAPLGWLKYFLAPMQDGQFYDSTAWVFFGRAIFIFAGGIFPRFKRFVQYSPSVASNPKAIDEDLGDALRQVDEDLEEIEPTPEFRSQKGPDFISRLRGHFDILPINGKRGDEKPIVRRAVLLRGIIEAEKLLILRNGLKTCTVHEDLLYAMLTIDRYRHGARSMAAVLKMCAVIDGQIENASLPSRTQLNMHVNAKEFFIRIQRSRFRRLSSDEFRHEFAMATANDNPIEVDPHVRIMERVSAAGAKPS